MFDRIIPEKDRVVVLVLWSDYTHTYWDFQVSDGVCVLVPAMGKLEPFAYSHPRETKQDGSVSDVVGAENQFSVFVYTDGYKVLFVLFVGQPLFRALESEPVWFE